MASLLKESQAIMMLLVARQQRWNSYEAHLSCKVLSKQEVWGGMLLRHIPLPHSLCAALTRWSHTLYAGGEGLGEEVTLHRSVYSVHFTTKQFYPEQCHHGNDNVNTQKQPRWITTQGGGNCPCNVMMLNQTLQPLRKGCEDFFAITSTVIHRLFHT